MTYMKRKVRVVKNGIIINGHIYELVPYNGEMLCKNCALDNKCKEMIEFPLCEILHGVNSFEATEFHIYKETPIKHV